MNTISINQNKINLYTQNSTQTVNNNEQIQESQKKKYEMDSFEISQEALQAMNYFNQQMSQNPLTSSLDKLVDDGTITKDQATSIQSAFEAARNSTQTIGTYSNKAKNPMDSLVESGIITSEEKQYIIDAFESSIKPMRPQQKQTNNPFDEVLDSLVSAGTISQEQKDAIQKAFEADRKAMEEKSNSGQKPADDLLDSLVAAGTISQEQEDVIKSSLV
jgi:polyhydroxyalkanoate synthesis regulator phasin